LGTIAAGSYEAMSDKILADIQNGFVFKTEIL